MVANAVLYSVISSLHSFLLKLYTKPIKKLIITTIIIANIIANSLKQVIILKNLPKDLKLFVTAIRAREERQSKQSLIQYARFVNKVGADYNKSLLIWRCLRVKREVYRYKRGRELLLKKSFIKQEGVLNQPQYSTTRSNQSFLIGVVN